MKMNIADIQVLLAEDTIPNGPRKISVQWTGGWPCFCHGEWIITIDGEKVELPKDVRTSQMGTFGKHSRWSFGGESGWEEEWETYEDGLTFEPWLEANLWWVADLHLTPSEQKELYDAINEKDWRHGECGGCI